VITLKVVQPIRDLDKLAEIMAYLKATSERNYIMFLIGIYTGLRISDILKLKVIDVQGDYIKIRENKKGKLNRLIITPDLKKPLRKYIAAKDDNEYLIVCRKGKNKPILRETAYQISSDAAKQCGLKEIGTHTLRKTFGYHFYQSTKGIAMLQNLLNHTDPDYTLRYIGVNQDSRDNAMRKFRYHLPSI
jgi:integrase